MQAINACIFFSMLYSSISRNLCYNVEKRGGIFGSGANFKPFPRQMVLY